MKKNSAKEARKVELKNMEIVSDLKEVIEQHKKNEKHYKK